MFGRNCRSGQFEKLFQLISFYGESFEPVDESVLVINEGKVLLSILHKGQRSKVVITYARLF